MKPEQAALLRKARRRLRGARVLAYDEQIARAERFLELAERLLGPILPDEAAQSGMPTPDNQ